ncbi:MAG: hypothetical protein F6K57_24590 [Moorea sp. SIO4A5]|nr:hypothetical protein [Moorena sp. SIO4A5]
MPIPILTTEIQKLYSVFHNYLPTSDFPLTCSLLPAPCSLKPKNLYLTELKTAISSPLKA